MFFFASNQEIKHGRFAAYEAYKSPVREYRPSFDDY